MHGAELVNIEIHFILSHPAVREKYSSFGGKNNSN